MECLTKPVMDKIEILKKSMEAPERELKRLQCELPVLGELAKRVYGEETTHSRIYVVEDKGLLARLRDAEGYRYQNLPNFQCFPLFGLDEERKVNYTVVPGDTISGLIIALQKAGIKSQHISELPLDFPNLFCMERYDVYLLDKRMKAPLTLRIGKAIPYVERQRSVSRRIVTPGHYDSGPGYDDWVPERAAFEHMGFTTHLEKGNNGVRIAIVSGKDMASLEIFEDYFNAVRKVFGGETKWPKIN